MSTIQDVARQAGVSTATVSNVLNNPNIVSEEKYTRVLKAIREMNYTPNLHATNLRTNRKNTVALVLPELSPPFAQLAEVIITELESECCITELTHYNSIKEKEILIKLISMGVSCIILYSCSPDKNTDVFKVIAEKKIPLISIQNRLSEFSFPYASLDLFSSAKKTAETALTMLFPGSCADDYLIVTGSLSMSAEKDCLNGFLTGFSSGNIPQHMSVRLGAELACLDFLNHFIYGENIVFPKYIVTTSETLRSGIGKAVELLGKNVHIITLSGDSWSAVESDRIHCFPTQTAQLGKHVSELVLRFLSDPRSYGSQSVILPDRASSKYTFPALPDIHGMKIRVLVYYRSWADMLQRLAEVYQGISGTEIEFECVPTSIEAIDRIDSIPHTGCSSPDIFVIPYYCMAQFSSEEYFIPLEGYLRNSPFPFSETYCKAVQNLCHFHDTSIFAIPFTFNTQMLFYRKDLFERSDIRHQFYSEYGIELSPPKTWTEFNTIARFFTKEYNPHSPVTYGTSIGMSQASPINDEFLPRQWAYHGRLFDEHTGRPTLTDLPNMKALSNIYETYRYTPGTKLLNSDGTSFVRILNNEIAMLNTFTTYIPNSDKGSVEYTNIACVNTPGGTPLTAGWLLGINQRSKVPDAAFHFINWVTNQAFSEQNAMLGLFNPQEELLNSVHCERVFPWTSEFLNGISKSGVRETMRTADGNVIYPRTVLNFLHHEFVDALSSRKQVENALRDINFKLTDIYDGKRKIS